MGGPRLPRVLLFRHGETEWSLSGQHTGRTDLPLTANGEETLRNLGKQIVGEGKLVCPQTVELVIASPRQRTQKTYQLLFEHLPKGERGPTPETTEDVREWDYGDYEGITSNEIHKTRPDWDIFTQGCPNGESPEQITERIDRVIARIKQVHEAYWQKAKNNPSAAKGGDILLITHGHYSKCFLARWVKASIDLGRVFVVDAGGCSVGGYQHHDLKEQSLLSACTLSSEHLALTLELERSPPGLSFASLRAAHGPPHPARDLNFRCSHVVGVFALTSEALSGEVLSANHLSAKFARHDLNDRERLGSSDLSSMAASEAAQSASEPSSPTDVMTSHDSPTQLASELSEGLSLQNSDSLTLRSLLNSKEAGVVIGKAGRAIAEMREATGCKAGVSKVVQGVQERVLSATGTTENVAKFYSLVAAALLENPLPASATSAMPAVPPTQTVIRLLVSHGHMGGIIGKQGAKIKQIQDASSTRMTASKDMLANSTERVVELTGTSDAIRIAVLEIGNCIFADQEKGQGTILFQPGGASPEAAVSPSAYLPSSTPNGTPARRVSRGGYMGSPAASSPGRSPASGRRTSRGGGGANAVASPMQVQVPPTTPAAAVAPNGETVSPTQTSSAPLDPALRTQNISIPSDMVGCIIGRGGQKINEIRRLSGSRINIAKVAHDETGERLFSIVGLPESNEKALYLLYSSLEAEKERRTRETTAREGIMTGQPAPAVAPQAAAPAVAV